MEFSHLDKNGRVKMVDVSSKQKTQRTAIAMASVRFPAECFDKIITDGVSKGDIFCIAKTAGIMGAKKTSELIPLCHPIFMASCDIKYKIDKEINVIYIYSQAKSLDYTGVEMEAIVAANIAAVTIYDMCKAVSKNIMISDCTLLYKTGGKSGIFKNENIASKHFENITEWL